jgi:hypothetical protein
LIAQFASKLLVADLIFAKKCSDRTSMSQSNCMDQVDFSERSAQLKALIEQARDAEVNAYEALKGIQGDMVGCITAEDVAALDRLEARYGEVEGHWKDCLLYTAELRAEMRDLIKERHGELPAAASSSGPHGATARVTVSTTRGLAHSPKKIKPAKIHAEDIGRERRALVASGVPDVNPRYANNDKLPIADAQIRVEFEQLIGQAGLQDGTLPLRVVAQYFGQQDSIGAPVNPLKWVAEALAKFKPDLRRRLARRQLEEDDPNTVSFDEFAYLVVKWAQM